MKPNAKGEIKASENVLKLMKTEKGRILASTTTTVLNFQFSHGGHKDAYGHLKQKKR